MRTWVSFSVDLLSSLNVSNVEEVSEFAERSFGPFGKEWQTSEELDLFVQLVHLDLLKDLVIRLLV